LHIWLVKSIQRLGIQKKNQDVFVMLVLGDQHVTNKNVLLDLIPWEVMEMNLVEIVQEEVYAIIKWAHVIVLADFLGQNVNIKQFYFRNLELLAC
jgi:hypothetical protein